MDISAKVNLLLEDRGMNVRLVYEGGEFILMLEDGTSSAPQTEPDMVQILETTQAAFDAMSSQQIIDYVKDVGEAVLYVRPKNLYKVVGLF